MSGAREKYVSVRIERGAYEEIAEVSRVTMVPIVKLIGVCVPELKRRFGLLAAGDGDDGREKK